MTDLFKDKAQDWDLQPIPARISHGVGAALLSAVTLAPNMDVMDFGAGTGLICGQLAPHVGRITAVDVSAAMLEKLAAKPELRGKVEAVCQDILVTPLERQFDLIVSAMAMHHVQDIERLIAVFAEHLRPGGRVALADLDSEDGTFHPADVHGVFHAGIGRDELREHLHASGFSEVRFVTALDLEKEGKRFPIFLVTATRV